ncbi:RraA family protein [Ktedonobacter robiniae]|uniref:Putative 4-hydroxy-4-methyl-2-oxoglutarate aldolase n=1 Tax=Ktedonobacter robiniae TaxID=2778365 RepID=A0ABQ3V447_9CHLR|nr:RraA family protein [Ktedonobacter robiniae]GHO59688.1 diguanylate cyclase [Ktedonobacter robiniae]
MREYPEWLSATLASDASEGKGVLPNYILPLLPGSRVVGPAYVALMSQDDNLAIRKVLEAPPEPGTVLVVAGGHASRTATVGDLLALEMQNAGLAGLITDGLVRDSREIKALEVFRVWCRGVTPTASRKDGPAVVGGRITFEETIVRDGDLIIADDDGVVIWPHEQIETLLTRAEARLQQDNERLARLRAQQR